MPTMRYVGFFEGFVLHEKNRIALPQYLLRSSGGGVAVYNNVLFHAMEVNNLVVCMQYIIPSYCLMTISRTKIRAISNVRMRLDY